MKNTFYFPHDYHARHDPKLEKLRMTMGCEGLGIYWCLIEMIYEQNGRLRLGDIDCFAKVLNSDADKINDVIADFDLFTKNGETFFSPSALERLEHINSKRQKASESAAKRWNANAMQTDSECNAIKESKVKKRKESNRAPFTPPSLEDVLKYCLERGNSVDAERWHNFYSAKDWMIGSNKIKDWKACVRTWERKEEEAKYVKPL